VRLQAAYRDRASILSTPPHASTATAYRLGSAHPPARPPVKPPHKRTNPRFIEFSIGRDRHGAGLWGQLNTAPDLSKGAGLWGLTRQAPAWSARSRAPACRMRARPSRASSGVRPSGLSSAHTSCSMLPCRLYNVTSCSMLHQLLDAPLPSTMRSRPRRFCHDPVDTGTPSLRRVQSACSLCHVMCSLHAAISHVQSTCGNQSCAVYIRQSVMRSLHAAITTCRMHCTSCALHLRPTPTALDVVDVHARAVRCSIRHKAHQEPRAHRASLASASSASKSPCAS
jgi:hypothetical protein